MNKKILDNFFKIIIFVPLISFIFGFYFDEDSAGGGGYKNDSIWIRENINIFLTFSLKDAILHPDLFGNRTPLIYILNKYLNPFFFDFEKYRTSVFFFSLIGPVFLYKILKVRFKEVDNKILFFISSLVYLSPYYRTSAFWGLNENYGIISSFISLYLIETFIRSDNRNILKFILIIFFSSITVYFDLKLLIIPLYCFYKILRLNISNNFKIISLIFYFLLSLPYLYLIYIWQGLVPPLTQLENPNTVTSFTDIKNIYFIHTGYAATIIAFYTFPLILFFKKDTLINFKDIIFSYKFALIIFLSFLYVMINFFILDFEKFTVTDYWIGLGVVHRLSLILTESIRYQELLTYFFILLSLSFISVFFILKKFDFYLISYFLIISLFLWPLMQEYFDPIILIIAFCLFNSIKTFNKLNSFFLFGYLSIFLIIANLYYS